jgi:hypothetical protein
MNHFNKKIQGWCTYEKFYRDCVEQAPAKAHFVEVGVWKGQSITFLAVEVFNSVKDIRIDAIDTWRGSHEHLDKRSQFYEPLLEVEDGLFNHFLENIEPVKNLIKVIRKSSCDAVKDYKNNSLDMVFIDASHDYENVLKDIHAWLPKVRSGGILAGHDINYHAVSRAVAECFGDKIIKRVNEDVWIYKVLSK